LSVAVMGWNWLRFRCVELGADVCAE
jgi:hypothetical protein